MTPRPIHLLTAAALAVTGAFAQNDECATAITLTVNTPVVFNTFGATTSAPAWPCAGGGTDLWYRFTAPAAGIFGVQTCGSSYDSALQVFSGTCASLTSLGCNDDSCGLQSRVDVTLTAGAVAYIRVGGFNAAAGGGTIEVVPVQAQPISLIAHYTMNDTGNTLNDASGNNISGVYQGGTKGQAGAASGTATSVDFALGEYAEIPGDPRLDALLNDFSVSGWVKAEAFAAGTNVMRVFGNQGPGGSWSFGLRGNLGLRFTTHAVLDYDIATVLTAGQWYHIAVVMDVLNDVTFYVNGAPIGTVAGTQQARQPNGTYLIGAWNPPGGIPEFFNGNVDDVQVYQGAISAAGIAQLYGNPGTTLGGSNPICCGYCVFVPNSTGQPGTISAFGTNSAAANNVQLVASQLPLNSFGFFLTSRTQGQVANPGGSQGTLCLGGAIGRYVGPGQIKNSGAAGSFALTLNLASTPTPTGPVAVQAGDTWNYQAWFRDSVNGVATSNFTNGRTITYN